MTTDQTTDLTPRDHEIIVVLQDELPPYDYAAAFARALQLGGASPQLLRGIASNYTGRDTADEFRMQGLPYIDVLLDNGWDMAQVRLFVTDMFAMDETGSHHQEGFVNSPDDWHICQTVEQLMQIFGRLAARYVLKPEVHKQLVAIMAKLRPDELQNQRDIEALEDRLAVELSGFDSAHQLTIALRAAAKLSKRERLNMANKLYPSGFNLVFVGCTMAAYPAADYELSGFTRELSAKLEGYPWQGADILRWLTMGFQLESREYWEIKLERSAVVRQLAYAGWHIVPVRATPTGELRATVPNEGPRITLVHKPGGETVQPGGKVIVSTEQLKDLTPTTTPAGKLYTLPLVPATAPTDEQLANPGTVFFARPRGTSKKKSTR